MRIVHIAAEFAPLAKTGGLGDAVVGLCRELTRAGEKVEFILPKYDFIDARKLPRIKMEIPDFKCLEYNNAMWSAEVEGCNVHLLEARHPAGYFHRGKIYGCEDDIPRFIYFSRAALEYLKLRNEPIDVLHLHDWHTALCAPLVKDLFKELKVKSIVINIHNVEYQGKCAAHDLDAIGLKGADYLKKDKMQDDNPAYPKTINLLKGGIVYSDAVVAVSPTYAKEIQTAEYGFHLDATLRKNKKKLHGILNGIDYSLWNPAGQGKAPNREAIKKRFSLEPKGLWLGTITRLVPQKAPELIEEALRTTLALGGTFVLLGSSPIPKIQAHFDQLKTKYKGNKQVVLHYDYDEALAHQIYAALDFLIVPSHFEPCGLTQLIAMHYGAIPIVRSTGGLKDTVFDGLNGFTFRDATAASFNEAIQKAFKTDSATLQKMVRNGMQADFSWEKPAQEYLKLYRFLSK